MSKAQDGSLLPLDFFLDICWNVLGGKTFNPSLLAKHYELLSASPRLHIYLFLVPTYTEFLRPEVTYL